MRRINHPNKIPYFEECHFCELDQAGVRLPRYDGSLEERPSTSYDLWCERVGAHFGIDLHELTAYQAWRNPEPSIFDHFKDSNGPSELFGPISLSHPKIARQTCLFRDMESWKCLRKALEATEFNTVRALSVGCSTGEELVSLSLVLANSRYAKCHSIVGIDPYPEAIKNARALLKGNPDHFVQIGRKEGMITGDLQKVKRPDFSRIGVSCDDILCATYPDESAQLVAMRNVAFHFTDKGRKLLLQRVSRILCRNGILMIGENDYSTAQLHGFGFKRNGPLVYVKN